MANQPTMQDIWEVVTFIKDNGVTKKELQEVESRLGNRLLKVEENMVTKTEFEQFKTEIYAHIDGFAKKYEAGDQELVVLRSKCERLEEIIFKMAKHLQLDVNQL